MFFIILGILCIIVNMVCIAIVISVIDVRDWGAYALIALNILCICVWVMFIFIKRGAM